LDASKVTVSNLDASKIVTGTLDGSVVNVVNLNASNINAGNLTADLITTGTFDISKVNVENFSANNIVAGTISGKDLSINLDTGAVNFESGIIKNNSNTFEININKGEIISGNSSGVMTINDADISYWKDTTFSVWQGQIALNSVADGDKYPSITLSSPAKILINPGNGTSMESTIIANKGDAVFGERFIELNTGSKLADSNLRSASAGFIVRNYEYGSTDSSPLLSSMYLNPYGSFSVNLPDKFETSYGSSHPTFGDKPLFEVFGGGMYLEGSMHIDGALTVNGNKQSIQATRDGVRGLIAYETAESYFGDIGEGSTDDRCKVTVKIDTLFRDTVNTSFPYQVFITPYGKGDVWVSERKSDHFVVESSLPGTSFGWEVKARRRGAESTRLPKADITFKQLQNMDEKHMENESKENKNGK